MPDTTRSYEEEQARLRRQHEGEKDDGLRIEPPKPPEINPEIIKDVEPMLFRGFLYVPSEINGVPFVFKSLNHHEFELLNMTADVEDRRGLRRFYNQFLAYGVLMVDGVNILPKRDQYLPEVAQMFGELDENARRKIIRYLSEINRRASRAVTLTEVYCMESQSRLRWSQYQKIDLTSPATTGFAGTQNLGFNWAQLTWRAVNYYEDMKEEAEREWENTKFIASAFAGSKGLSSVNSQDKQRREREQAERIERRDKIIRTVVLGIDPDKGGGPTKGLPMQVARTVEELADQLERDFRGEKDWHDQVVEAHEQRVQQEYEDRMRQLESFRDAHVQKYGDRPIIGGTDVIEGLSRDEVQERIRRRQEETVRRLSTQQVYPEALDPKVAQFRQKWASLRSPKRGG